MTCLVPYEMLYCTKFCVLARLIIECIQTLLFILTVDLWNAPPPPPPPPSEISFVFYWLSEEGIRQWFIYIWINEN